MMATEYIEPAFIAAVKSHPLWWQKQGLSFAASGYGSNIPTDKVAYCADNRRRRIRAACHSNAASLYIVVKGEKRFIRECDLPAVTQ